VDDLIERQLKDWEEIYKYQHLRTAGIMHRVIKAFRKERSFRKKILESIEDVSTGEYEVSTPNYNVDEHNRKVLTLLKD